MLLGLSGHCYSVARVLKVVTRWFLRCSGLLPRNSYAISRVLWVVAKQLPAKLLLLDGCNVLLLGRC